MKHVADMVKAAEAEIETLSVEQASELHVDDSVQFVDLRDVRELYREGKVSGAYHAPRGMLECWIDPQSPYHKPLFAEQKKFVFYCQSGWRSALATHTAQQMGMTDVCHIEGGYRAWKEAGAPTEPVQHKG